MITDVLGMLLFVSFCCHISTCFDLYGCHNYTNLHHDTVRSFSALEQLTGSKYFMYWCHYLFTILMLFVFINVLLTLVAQVTVK